MAPVLKESGETSLFHARKASQKLEEGNIGAAKTSLAEAEISAGKHMKEIMYWIERHTVIQEHYEQQERELTANINNVLAKQQSVESQKRDAETQLGCERNELSRHRSDLSSAEDCLSDAKRRAREANTGKVITGIAAGLLTIFTFGAAAPVAAPLAVGAAGGAIAFGQAEKEAENDIRRCRGRIEDTARKISNIESSISSLSSTISQLSSERSSYMSQRSRLQEEKGKMKDVISFLLDAQKYGIEFFIATEGCIDHTDLTGKVTVKAEAQGYSLFDESGTKRVLATFEEAWKAFEEMNEKGSNYIFEIDFQCTHCSKSYREFPHVSSGQLICSSCYCVL